MSVQPINEAFPVVNQTPEDNSIYLAYSEGHDSRKSFSEFRSALHTVEAIEKPEGEALASIQASARAWAESNGILDMPEDEEGMVDYYSTFSRDRVEAKIGGLVEYLRQNHADEISEEELKATEMFVDSTFKMYEDQPAGEREVMDDASGSFAFIVPTRMSRKHAEYGQEVEPIIPALRYMPNETRAQMLAGLPPFVIDTYRPDETGRHGVLVLAPVFEDIRQDIPGLSSQIGVAVNNVNAAVDFAHRRFGVEVVGLGATLPALTMYGKKITNPNVITTTGHGGTTELITKTLEAGLEAKDQSLRSVGVLGMGAIGASLAQVVADKYPDASINIYDTATARSNRVANSRPGRFEVMDSDNMLVEESQVVISAITGQFDTSKVSDAGFMDKLIIDDSQPGSFDPEAVEKRGGNVLWVIGRDQTAQTVTREGYDYGTMVNPNTDVFGCEAEAGTLYAYMRDLEARGMGGTLARRITGRVAIQHAVNVQDVRYMSALFTKFGIDASEPQAFGKTVDLR